MAPIAPARSLLPPIKLPLVDPFNHFEDSNAKDEPCVGARRRIVEPGLHGNKRKDAPHSRNQGTSFEHEMGCKRVRLGDILRSRAKSESRESAGGRGIGVERRRSSPSPSPRLYRTLSSRGGNLPKNS